MAHVDMPPKLVGRAVGMTLSPLPPAKRKRRFAKIEEEYVEDVHDHDDEDESEESTSPEASHGEEAAK
jgi:translation initiation factor IF-3